MKPSQQVCASEGNYICFREQFKEPRPTFEGKTKTGTQENILFWANKPIYSRGTREQVPILCEQ